MKVWLQKVKAVFLESLEMILFCKKTEQQLSSLTKAFSNRKWE